MNRENYTYLARITKGYPVWFSQKYGARVHFNHMTLECPIQSEMSDNKLITLRYGVVEYNDMLRDLKYWEALVASSFLQRPHTILHPEQMTDELEQSLDRNLTSALAFAALVHKPG